MSENHVDHRKELLGLIVRNPKLLLPWIFESYAFDAKWIDAHTDLIDWNRLSANTHVQWTAELVLNYREKWHIELLCRNPALPWSHELIKAIKRPMHRLGLSSNKGLPWSHEFILSFKDKWHYPYLMHNTSIPWSEELLLEIGLKDQSLKNVNGPDLWNTSFLDRYAHELDWSSLTYNQHIHWDETMIGRYERFFKPFEQKSSEFSISPWKGISSNSNVPWSTDFIESYKKRLFLRPYGLYWKELSGNETLPWNEEDLLTRYEKDLNWKAIGLNKGISWTESQFERFQHHLPWQNELLSVDNISGNENLPWSAEFIHRYHDKWNWWALSRNEGINLTPELIEEFKPHLVELQLLLNKRAPWTMNFILTNEHLIQQVWSCADETFKGFIWEKFFAPCMDEQFLEDLFRSLSNPFRYRSMVNEEEMDILQKSIMHIGDDLAKMDTSNYLFTHDTHSIDTFRDELQQTLYKIANAPERESRLQHQRLHILYKNLGDAEKNIAQTFSDHVYELLTMLTEMVSNYPLTRAIYLRHRNESKAFVKALKEGVHLNQNMAYYTSHIKKFGHRPMEMTALLVAIEELDPKTYSKKLKTRHTSPF